MAARQQVGFLSGISNKESLIPHFAKDNGRLTRKKLTDAPYTSQSINTFRVLGEQAEWEKTGDWESYKTRSRPQPPEKINEPLSQVPFPLKENLVHHIPHSRTASFIRTNVRFINKPIWFIEPEPEPVKVPQSSPAKLDSQPANENKRDFFSASYIGQPGTNVPEPIVTTYKGDYLGNNSYAKRNTRHGSNFEHQTSAHGVVPVNELREKNGKQRFYEEKMSYRHVYDSRSTPNYPHGLKKQGAFVWDRVMYEPPVLPNLQSPPPQQQRSSITLPAGSQTVTPTSNWAPSRQQSKKVEFSESVKPETASTSLNISPSSIHNDD